MVRRLCKTLALLLWACLLCAQAFAQFIDSFERPSVATDPRGIRGWRFAAGDGTAAMDLRQGGNDYASLFVDATRDRRNVWWALIERQALADADLERTRQPGMELRIEARIRVSHAPRRLNLQLRTQRTAADDHSFLMEFDIPDTKSWHTISMTTHGFDAQPGDVAIAHLALMDWGLDKYRVDVDYVKVDVVNTATCGPDQGAAVPYHPPIADPRSYAQAVRVTQDAMIDLVYRDVSMRNWSAQDKDHRIKLRSVDGTHDVILRWELSAYAGRRVAGHGQLELTTRSMERSADELKDFGLVRLVEILGGDPGWDGKTVTTESFCNGQLLDQVLNPQMIIDWPVTEGDKGKTYLTIGNPVLQRMIDGKTLGIAVTPLGAIHASFYSVETDGGTHAAVLRFNLEQ